MYKEEKMKTLNELFPKAKELDIVDAMMGNNILAPHGFRFSDRINVVIGKNGSGKTRLLKAIKTLYEADDSNNVMYGYFPSLSDVFSPNNEIVPDYSLYEFLYSEEAKFEDLLKSIEEYGVKFIEDLESNKTLMKQQQENMHFMYNNILMQNYIMKLKIFSV